MTDMGSCAPGESSGGVTTVRGVTTPSWRDGPHPAAHSMTSWAVRRQVLGHSLWGNRDPHTGGEPWGRSSMMSPGHMDGGPTPG